MNMFNFRKYFGLFEGGGKGYYYGGYLNKLKKPCEKIYHKKIQILPFRLLSFHSV